MKVLVVDDHALFCEGARVLLARLAGADVSDARSLAAAEELSRGEQPDLILLDYFLPDSDRTAGIERLAAAAPNAKGSVFTLHLKEAPAGEFVAAPHAIAAAALRDALGLTAKPAGD